jgi:hypothetical protein
MTTKHPREESSGPLALITVPEVVGDAGPQSRGQGLIEQLTYQCYVGLTSEPGVFTLASRRKSVMALLVLVREVTYLLFRRLEKYRRIFRSSLATPQYAVGGLTGVAAKHFILPRFAGKGYSLSALVAPEDLTWFETSRRVVEYQIPAGVVPNDRRRSSSRHQIICYLFAPDSRDAIDRLFLWYVTKAPADAPTRWIYDGQTDFLMRSRLLRRVQPRRLVQRWYYDVTIVPRELIRVDVESLLSQGDVAMLDSSLLTLSPKLQSKPVGDSLIGDMDVDKRPRAHRIAAKKESPAVVSSALAFEEGYAEQADSNWEFIVSEITAAQDQGRELDEVLIEGIARKQMVFARHTQNYGERPGAGPTRESAELMVRSVVELYQLGTDALGEARPATDGQ